jgi:mRNA interferase MazF
MTEQLLVRLPEELVRRFKRAVAPRQRSKFIEPLLEQALPPDEVSDSDPLYQAALAVEQDETLAGEMAEWEEATIEDGFGPDLSKTGDAVTDAWPRSAAPVRRGEIWWVNFDPTQGSVIRKTRPAVVVTDDPLNRARRTVVVVPLSSGPQPRPPLVVATPSAGTGSVAIYDQLRAVDKRHLTRNEGRLSATDLLPCVGSLSFEAGAERNVWEHDRIWRSYASRVA